MSEVILKVEHISKQYRLGLVGTGTLSHDLKRWFYSIQGKDDPFLKIGDTNDRSKAAESDYVWAIKDISFEVKRGEVLGIIGKNGAGKSTLLKILSRVTSPTTGQIKTKGRIASLLEVGTGFHPELTGKENIYLNGAILGMTKAEIKAKEQEIIEFSGCQRYIDTPVKRYSSGMRVRLAFAVAAFLEPDILVVDEVLAVGDSEFQKKAIGKMQDISKGEGRTVLFVSHNMAAVISLCTRAIVINNGEIIADMSANEAVELYLQTTSNTESEIIEKRKDRINNGNFIFTDLNILNTQRQKVSALLAGDSYFFQVFFKSKFELRNVKIRLQFLDSNGQMRFLCNNHFSNTEIFNLPQNAHGYIVCEIPKFPLPKGFYSIKLTCFSDNGLEDEIERALDFDVEGGDFYKSGKEQISKEGVLVNYKFKFDF
ncbi:ABC transporter ATP-binding protein [uncultured Winogradskyella sp.]|uniref:ABC transporter ATP-binding protein n=1 Tax=uncultured Winogradskyella sp. TaxID=395353 RepID=UPI0035193C7A